MFCICGAHESMLALGLRRCRGILSQEYHDRAIHAYSGRIARCYRAASSYEKICVLPHCQKPIMPHANSMCGLYSHNCCMTRFKAHCGQSSAYCDERHRQIALHERESHPLSLGCQGCVDNLPSYEDGSMSLFLTLAECL